MAILNISLNPPKNIQDTILTEIKKVEEVTKTKNLRIGEEKLTKIASKVCKMYDCWDKQTRPMRNRLVVLNEILEGVVKPTNFPFDGASNITIGYAAGMARTFKATFNKTAYQDPNIFSATSKNKEELSINDTSLIEESINNNFYRECNGLDVLKSGTVPCFRDGTLILTGYWNRIIEMCNDVKIYKDSNEFMDDYPDFEAAGISEEEYNGILDNFIADPELEVRCTFQYKSITQDGPEYEVVPLAQFPTYPVCALSLSKMEMYGRIGYETKVELKAKAKLGEYYPSQVEKLLSAASDAKNDRWSASRNFIEGLVTHSSVENNKPYLRVEAVVKLDLDNDSINEKYLITFSPERKIVLAFQPYHLRNNVDMCVDFRFIERDGRFYGGSLLADGQDKFELLDTLHRHRNNIRTLVTSPILLIQKRIKDDVDLNRSESVVRPGVAYYVDDVNTAMKQLKLENLDQPGNSADEENLIVRYLELSIGPTQALSGKETPSDPRAPMGKTLALMNQANLRVDDYLDIFRRSIPKLAQLHTALLSQYGPDKIKYSIDQDGKIEFKELDKNLYLSKFLFFGAKRRSVTISPEFAMQRLGGLMQVYKALQQGLMMKDPISIQIWNRMIIASGEPDKESLVISAQNTAVNVGNNLNGMMPPEVPAPQIPPMQTGMPTV